MVSQAESHGSGCMFVVLALIIAMVTMFLSFMSGRRYGRDEGEFMSFSACRQACEARQGIRMWNEDTDTCVCRDWSAWRIEAHATRLRPSD